MGEIQQGDRKGKGGVGRGVGADRMVHEGKGGQGKGKGQLSLSSTLSCFMCPSLAALVLPGDSLNGDE